MNLHHLRIFQAIAASGSTTAAAERLLISQSAISSQLKQLERFLKTPLFDRLPTGMALTAAGNTLREYADRIFNLADEAAEAVRDLQFLKRGSLRIGSSPTIGVYFLPPVLLHFQRRFPNIRLHVEMEEHDVLEQRLRDGLLDVAYSPIAPSFDDLRVRPFMNDEFIAVVSRHDPLARRNKATVRTIAARFIARQLPSATGSLTAGYFSSHGIPMRPVLSLGSLEAVKQAVITGLGVTIISKMAVTPELASKQLRVLEVSGLPMRRPLYAICRSRPESKAAIAFGCLLKHAVHGSLPKLV